MKINYREGSIFLVPLQDGSFARGVVARAAPRGRIVFGYFFGPRLRGRENAQLEGLEPETAALALFFGDLGLVKGLWPIVGQVYDWDRARWPLRDVVRRDPLGKLTPMLVRYDDSDPGKVLSETPIAIDNDLLDDGLAGHGYVEARLSKLLT
jgi:hypothetical protein